MLEVENIRSLSLEGHVGFDSLPDQQVSKAVQKGFVFNILCVGETGVGKSTLMDSLFNTTFDSCPSPHGVSSVTLKTQTYDLWEKNVQMKLTLVDTVGFGDQVNKEDSSKSIVDHIDKQFEAYLHEELKVERCLSLYQDTRIHVCLYFISPTGHGLKSIDLECMKKLDSKVNIIPIIAKADAISKAELKKLKEKIVSEIASNSIKIYQFPTDDETIAETNGMMNSHLPFAVVGSREFIRVGNKTLRARQYPWGTVQVENESHCDTAKLREMLIRTNLEDLRETTHNRHYELYRRGRMEQIGLSDDNVNQENEPISFQEACLIRVQLHREELEEKEEAMKKKFVQRIKAKDAELEEHKRKVFLEHELVLEEHAREKRELEELQKALEDEMADFAKLTEIYENQMMSPRKQSSSSGFLSNSFSLGSLKGKKSK